MPCGVYPRKPNQKMHPLHSVWRGMIERCKNKNHISYARYGARGIEVCVRWEKFANFVEDMKERPSNKHQLDRINNDGNYEPENCRWATAFQQTRNVTRNKAVIYQGKRYCVTELSELTGIRPPTLYSRIDRGCSVEEIVSPPKHTLTWNGITKTWVDWSKCLGIPYNTILKRAKSGKPIEVIIENGISRSGV